MKNNKAISFYKLVISILLITLIVAVVGIAASGWQTTKPDPTPNPNTPSTPQTPGDPTPPDNDLPDEEDKPPVIKIPDYVNYLTGLEVTKDIASLNPLAVVMTADKKGYGLSQASITIEFPLENGQTRFLTYINDTSTIGQLGVIAPSRLYISDMLRSFGGLLVAYGSDDRVSYDGVSVTDKLLDIKTKAGCSYTEGLSDIYTNGYLISNGLSSSTLQTQIHTAPSIPFRFVDFGAPSVTGASSAASVFLPYSENNTTKFVYKESEKTYTLYKNDQPYTDLLNKSTVSYTNLFVLFADATTYEKTDMTQTIVDTSTGGAGYYITEGGAMRISWKCAQDGSMHFYDTAGLELTANRGTSYISFFKSSLSSEVHFG